MCVSTTEQSTQNVFLWVHCEISLPEVVGKMLLSAVRKCCHSSASCHTGTSWSIRWGWRPVAGIPAPTHSSSLRWWTHPERCDLWGQELASDIEILRILQKKNPQKFLMYVFILSYFTYLFFKIQLTRQNPPSLLTSTSWKMRWHTSSAVRFTPVSLATEPFFIL